VAGLSWTRVQRAAHTGWLRRIIDRLRDMGPLPIVITAGGVTVIILAVVAVRVGLMTDRIREPVRAPNEITITTRSEGVLVRNWKGGYEIETEPSWDVRRRGTRTVITRPDGDAVVTVGLSKPGEELMVTFQSLRAELQRTYGGFWHRNVSTSLMDGRLAIESRYQLRNRAGRALDLIAVVVAANPRNVVALRFTISPRPLSLNP
jgi:hypothetical protein